MDLIKSLLTLHNHLWGKNVIKSICVAGKNCSTLDLALFKTLPQNITYMGVLLIRDEYVLAYNTILEDIHTLGKWNVCSSFLVTGQPGIGKTLFLIYILVRQLQEQQPVAFQINSGLFALFDEHGVKLCSTSARSSSEIPPGTWALSDAGHGQTAPCGAFHSEEIHVIYTSPPRLLVLIAGRSGQNSAPPANTSWMYGCKMSFGHYLLSATLKLSSVRPNMGETPGS